MPRRRSFATSLLLTGGLVVLMSLGGGWGRAYGSTAGPTPTPSQAVLSVTKEADTSSTAPGGSIIFIIRVTNTGSTPARNIQLVDMVPPALEVTHAYATQGTVNVSGQRVTDQIAQLDAGATVIMTVETRVREDAQGQIVNQIVVNATNIEGAAIAEQRAEAVVGISEGASDTGSSSNNAANAGTANGDGGVSSQLSNTGADNGITWELLALGIVLIGVGGLLFHHTRKTS